MAIIYDRDKEIAVRRDGTREIIRTDAIFKEPKSVLYDYKESKNREKRRAQGQEPMTERHEVL